MQKLKIFLWILTGLCSSLGFLFWIAPDIATSLSRGPVSVGNAVIVAVAHKFGAEPMFVLSPNAADYVLPLLIVGTYCSASLLLLHRSRMVSDLVERERSAWQRGEDLAQVHLSVIKALIDVPGYSMQDQLAYAVICCEDFETACELLGVEDGEELLPAIRTLLAKQEIAPAPTVLSPAELVPQSQTF